MGYIRESRSLTEDRDVIVGCDCDNCGMNLEPVDVNSYGAWQSCQPVDALDIMIGGGYGQFFDGRTLHLVLCKLCAVAFVTQFPVIGKLMEEAEL